MSEDYDEIRVILYARVSTDDKDQNPETQVQELLAFCKNNGYVVADRGEAVFIDKVSGKAWNNDGEQIVREGIEKILGRVTRGDIDYVIARSQDRLSRNIEEYESIKRRVWVGSGKKTRVRFSTTDVKPETYGGTVMDALQASMGQAENLKRSIETRKGQMQARREGRHVNRFLAICLDTKIEENRSRIHFKGDVCHRTGKPVKSPTVILTKDEIMDCAKAGMSLLRASKVLNVKRQAFYDFMVAEGLKDEYTGYQKGILPTAVGEINREAEKTLPGKISERGTPDGNGTTVDGKGAQDVLL